MSTELTEEELSAIFEDALRNGEWAKHFPRFAHVVREVDCQQGRADFIASPARQTLMGRDRRAQFASALATPSSAKILSLLKRSAARTESYLRRASGLSSPVIRRALFELLALRLVVRSGKSGYVLSPTFPAAKWELWAFEVKIDKWQRALFQALQYRAFAHRVCIVMPERWVHRVESRRDLFRSLKVGIIAIDEVSGAIRPILRPRKGAPASQFHHLFALGKFLAPDSKVARTR